MRTVTRFVLVVLITLLAVPAVLFLIGSVASALNAVNQPNPSLRSRDISAAFLSVSLAFSLAVVPAFIALLMHIEHHLHRIVDHLCDVSIATRSMRDMTLEEHKRTQRSRESARSERRP